MTQADAGDTGIEVSNASQDVAPPAMGGAEELEQDVPVNAEEVGGEENDENEENKNVESPSEDEKSNDGVGTNNNAHLIRQIGPITISS